MRMKQWMVGVAVATVAVSLGSQSVGARREQTADQQVSHALNRLAFGARPGDVDRVRAMGVDRWIEQQLRPDRVDDAAIDRFLKKFPTLAQDQNTLLGQYAEMVADRQARKGEDGADAKQRAADSASMRRMVVRSAEVVLDLQASRVARAIASERQLVEVMVDFWENHFNIYARKGGPQPYYLVEFDQHVIRPNALGKFRDLLGAVAKSPAMLWYLDNARSRADSMHETLVEMGEANRGGRGIFRRRRAPAGPRRTPQQKAVGLNENYGRELLELHTLGVDGGYSQRDVIDVARALTGWSIRPPKQGGGFIFRPVMHDAAPKVVLGHTLPGGRGIEEGEEVLDILAKHPATARFIATKLVRRFVSDEPPDALVDRAAVVFQRTDGDIREVVRAIVTSPEFFSRASYRSKVKSPFEVVVSAARALNAEPDSTPRTALAIAYLGQPIFGHQAPNGWPEVSNEWMNTGAILSRINFGLAVAANRLPGTSVARWPSAATLTGASREQQVDGVIAALLGGAVSPETRKILLTGENPMMTAPARGDSSGEDASSMSGMEQREEKKGARKGMLNGRGFGTIPRLSGLAQVIGLALGAPEFQRR